MCLGKGGDACADMYNAPWMEMNGFPMNFDPSGNNFDGGMNPYGNYGMPENPSMMGMQDPYNGMMMDPNAWNGAYDPSMNGGMDPYNGYNNYGDFQQAQAMSPGQMPNANAVGEPSMMNTLLNTANRMVENAAAQQNRSQAPTATGTASSKGAASKKTSSGTQKGTENRDESNQNGEDGDDNPFDQAAVDPANPQAANTQQTAQPSAGLPSQQQLPNQALGNSQAQMTANPLGAYGYGIGGTAMGSQNVPYPQNAYANNGVNPLYGPSYPPQQYGSPQYSNAQMSPSLPPSAADKNIYFNRPAVPARGGPGVTGSLSGDASMEKDIQMMRQQVLFLPDATKDYVLMEVPIGNGVPQTVWRLPKGRGYMVVKVPTDQEAEWQKNAAQSIYTPPAMGYAALPYAIGNFDPAM